MGSGSADGVVTETDAGVPMQLASVQGIDASWHEESRHGSREAQVGSKQHAACDMSS